MVSITDSAGHVSAPSTMVFTIVAGSGAAGSGGTAGAGGGPGLDAGRPGADAASVRVDASRADAASAGLDAGLADASVKRDAAATGVDTAPVAPGEIYAGPWTEHDGLSWSDATVDGKGKDWATAGTYCTASGGRLPTLAELRKLVTGCPTSEVGPTAAPTSCPATDGCLAYTTCASGNATCDGCGGIGVSYSVFGDDGFFWSGSARSDASTNPNLVDGPSGWGIFFGSARIYTINVVYKEFVRCVR